jgi:hypothetical protein
VSSLDLFRWSDLSDQFDVIDWTADTRAKFFTVDRGATRFGRFSTGVTRGDGNQASHWKDNLGFGILDPTAARGEFLSISDLDMMAFDAIGWNAISLPGAVPLPGSLPLASLALLGLAYRRRNAHVTGAQK